MNESVFFFKFKHLILIGPLNSYKNDLYPLIQTLFNNFNIKMVQFQHLNSTDKVRIYIIISIRVLIKISHKR